MLEILALYLLLIGYAEYEHSYHHHHHHRRTVAIEILFGDHHMASPSSVSLLVAALELAVINPVASNGSNSNGTVSNAAWGITDDTVASLVQNADQSATLTALKAGTATLTVSCTVTDTNGAVNTFTASATVTVTAATAPGALTVGINILFSSVTPATTA